MCCSAALSSDSLCSHVPGGVNHTVAVVITMTLIILHPLASHLAGSQRLKSASSRTSSNCTITNPTHTCANPNLRFRWQSRDWKYSVRVCKNYLFWYMCIWTNVWGFFSTLNWSKTRYRLFLFHIFHLSHWLHISTDENYS